MISSGAFQKTIVQARHSEPATDSSERFPMHQLRGPNLPGRAWDKLLGGKSSTTSSLSRCVPENFYLAEFRSAALLLSALEQGRRWADYFATQVHANAAQEQLVHRLREQLALDVSPSMRNVLESTTTQIALTGSDPFLTEGSDLTVLLQLRRPQDFARAYADRTLEDAAARKREVRRTQGRLLGVDYVALRTPDRSLCVYAANPLPDLHVRSNSEAALRRVIEAVRGKTETGQPVRRLGETAELKYIRSLLLLPGAGSEDGFLYVSEAFLRHLVSPALKLTERRRLLGHSHLKMIGYAAQMYRTQYGKAPTSLEDLARAGCVPGEFNKGALACPFGGTYSLSADQTAGVSSVLNRIDFLTPCCELPVTEVTTEEAHAYAQYVRDYDRSWASCFDPVALRLQLSGKQLRAEALVLPLPANPVYASLARFLGGPVQPLDALPVPARSLFSVNLRFNPDHDPLYQCCAEMLSGPTWLQRMAHRASNPEVVKPSSPTTEQRPALAGVPATKVQEFFSKGLGQQVGMHVYDTGLSFDVTYSAYLEQLLSLATREAAHDKAGLLLETYVPVLLASTLTAPVYLSLPVQDSKIVDEFLELLDPFLAERVPAWRANLAPALTEVSGDFYHLTARQNLKVRALALRLGPVQWRWFWARIGDGLYVTNQLAVLEDLQEAYRLRYQRKASDAGPMGHALVRFRAEHLQRALAQYQLGWAANNRAACQRNLSQLSTAARAFATTPPVSQQAPTHEDRQRQVLELAGKMFGASFSCPDGGQYLLAEDGRSFHCTVHGSQEYPQQPEMPSRASPTQAVLDLADLMGTLTISSDGLRVTLTISQR
jgi:hypothetical protein